MARVLISFCLLSAMCMVMAQRRRLADTADAKSTYIAFVRENVERSAMPASDKGPLKVAIGFTPRAVVDVERNGHVDILGYLQMTWTDLRLTGSAIMRDRLQNVTFVSISPDAIWLPDIELVSPGKVEILNQRLEAVVNPQTGDVMYIPFVKIRNYCDIIGQVQQGHVSCSLKFMSWTRDKSVLDVQVGDTTLADFSITGPWNVTEITGTRHEKTYPGYPMVYPDVTFDYTIRGRLYYPG